MLSGRKGANKLMNIEMPEEVLQKFVDDNCDTELMKRLLAQGRTEDVEQEIIRTAHSVLCAIQEAGYCDFEDVLSFDEFAEKLIEEIKK
jgi:hypothetical protein